MARLYLYDCIALTTLLLQPNPAKLIVIDEPELGLHPVAISKLAGLMKSVKERGTQIIAATQSADLNSQDGWKQRQLNHTKLRWIIFSSTPEEINNGPNTAPSVRLKNAIKGYQKDIYGGFLADDIGLPTIRERCPLFNQWITRLESTL